MRVTWNDSSRIRVANIHKLITYDPPRLIQFVTDQGREYTFRPLTLTRYLRHVRPYVEGKPVFTSTKEVQHFYEHDFGNEYLSSQRGER